MGKLLFDCLTAVFISFLAATLCYGQNTDLLNAVSPTLDCPDDECVLPLANESGEQVFGVVSPVGHHTLPMIKQAPRLSTLDGKTIALVGGSFNASITHTELKRLILQKYPSAKVYVLSEVGNAGQYYAHSRQVMNFQDKLQQLKVDAVVSGNAGCGICTLKEVGNCIAAEYIGIPSVTIGAPTFVKQINSTSVNRGVPVPRTAVYPGAFSAHTREELIENTRDILFDQIIGGLTMPITVEEIVKLSKTASGEPKDLVFTGTYEEANAFFQENRWTDGLPIVLPTVAKIEEFLKYTPYAWDAEVGVIHLL